MPTIHSVARPVLNHQDRFFVDTNVWFWFTYCAQKEMSSINAPLRYQSVQYPKFIERVLDAGAKLYHCPLTYTELANIIEKTEFNSYESNNPGISRKEFRSIKIERSRVISEIDMAWRTVNSISTCLDITLNNAKISSIHTMLGSSTLDSYDALYLSLMQHQGINKIITDDTDFANSHVDYIYTANNKILNPHP